MTTGPLHTDLSTADSEGRRRWIFPIPAFGKWHRLRKFVAWALIAWLLAAPWFKVGGHQAVFFDLIHRKIHFLGFTFWVNEMVIFMFFTLAVLVAIVFLTVVLGRVFCGWACPLTVFMEFVFRPIERMIEGFGSAQKKFKSTPLSERVIPLIVKWGLFAGVSFILANTFVAYLMGSHRMLELVQEGPSLHWGPFVFMLISFGIILFQYGWFREQICLFVCPYGRLQSVLLDRDSLIVAYDKKRGEPRGKKGSTTGDCIDCKLCVNVCPTGIDIRQGLQLECIHCTQCVDACDSIMKKIDRPPGLIRYQTEAQVEHLPSRFWRPRLAIYSIVLAAVTSVLVGFAANRSLFKATLHRDATRIVFSIDPTDQKVINPVHLQITSRSETDLKIRFEPVSPSTLEVVAPEGVMNLKAMEKGTAYLIVKLPRGEFKENFGLKDVVFRAVTDEGAEQILELRVMGPAS